MQSLDFENFKDLLLSILSNVEKIKKGFEY